jgi:hypothetical protein
MESTTAFSKINASSKKALLKFQSNGNKRELFKSVRSEVAKRGTGASRHNLQSVFRGILRNHFGLSNDDMSPIAFTEEEKKEYHAVTTSQGMNRQTDVIDAATLDALLNHSAATYLLVTSGLRVNELFGGVDVRADGVYARISKKQGETVAKIGILGSLDKWKELYAGLDKSGNITSKTNEINVGLKKILPGSVHKQSGHLLRGVYARYIDTFRSAKDVGDNITSAGVIARGLHHDNIKSAAYYDNVRFARDVTDVLKVEKMEAVEDGVFTLEGLTKMKSAGLSELLTKRKVAGRSKLTKKADKVAALLGL